MSWQPWCKFIFCFSWKTVSKRNTASNVLLRLSPARVLTSRQILWVRVVEKLKQQTQRCCIWQIPYWEKVNCLSSFDSWTGDLSHLASCSPSVPSKLSSFSTWPARACSRAEQPPLQLALRCSWWHGRSTEGVSGHFETPMLSKQLTCT